MAHLKRLVAPKTWGIKRKGIVFVTRQNPRAKSEFTVPMTVVLRDMLRVVNNESEARKVLRERKIMVNGKVRLDRKFPVALFDIVEIPSIGKKYQVTFTKLGRLTLAEVHKAAHRLLRIDGKTKISGGKTQLNLFDGTNVLVPKDEYKVGDFVKVSIPDNKVSGKISAAEGSKILVIGGSHRGEVANIQSLHLGKTPKEVRLKNEAGEFLTRFNYIHLIE